MAAIKRSPTGSESAKPGGCSLDSTVPTEPDEYIHDVTVCGESVIRGGAGGAGNPAPKPSTGVEPALEAPETANRPTNRFGFFTDGPSARSGVHESGSVKLENLRTEKWRIMLKRWESFANTTKLKSRLRKGIPDAVRGLVWRRLAIIESFDEGLYSRVLDASTGTRPSIFETIDRDISRTFPLHAMFSAGGTGRAALQRVLHAYAIFDSEVGYCQGMGFIVGLFLSYMPEKPAFQLLVSVMKHSKYALAGIFGPGMTRVGLLVFQFQTLLDNMFPALAKHLDDQGVHATMYCTQWFITLFTNSFPFSVVVRIWDCFLYEGWKVIFRVALALMSLSAGRLKKLEFEGIMTHFRFLPEMFSVDEIMERAFRLRLKRATFERLEREYWSRDR